MAVWRLKIFLHILNIFTREHSFFRDYCVLGQRQHLLCSHRAENNGWMLAGQDDQPN